MTSPDEMPHIKIGVVTLESLDRFTVMILSQEWQRCGFESCSIRSYDTGAVTIMWYV